MMETEEIIIYMLLFIFGVGGFLLIQNAIPSLDMAAWTFTGHEIVETFMPYVSWLYLVAMLLVPTYRIIKEYG